LTRKPKAFSAFVGAKAGLKMPNAPSAHFQNNELPEVAALIYYNNWRAIFCVKDAEINTALQSH